MLAVGRALAVRDPVADNRRVVWRTVRARDRRSPAGFIRPCQPVLAREIPTGDEWIHELKWDGYRIIARRDNGVVHVWSRSGRNWAKDFLAIGAVMAGLPAESVILDGAAVCLLEDGRPDFQALRSRKACKDARLIAYDLLSLNSEDLRKMPLHECRKRLECLLSGNDVIRFSSNVEGRKGASLFRRAWPWAWRGSSRSASTRRIGLGPFSAGGRSSAQATSGREPANECEPHAEAGAEVPVAN